MRWRVFKIAVSVFIIVGAQIVRAQSVFEDYVKSKGGHIPFPIENLVQDMESHGGKKSGLLVPKGRSPESKDTDHAHPRVITTFTEGSPFKNKIFLGWVEKLNQLRVFSWNEKNRQYDVLTYDNYTASNSGHPTPSDTTSCTLCHQSSQHQSNSIIFMNGAWADTNEVGSKTNVAKIKSKMHGKTFYHGFPLESREGLTFQDAVRDASRFQQLSQICAQVCGKDLSCRKTVLELALIYPKARGVVSSYPDSFFDSLGVLKKQTGAVGMTDLTALEAQIQRKWPSDGFAYVDPLIADLPPGFGSLEDLKKSPEAKKLDMAKYDPATARPLIYPIPKANAEGLIVEAASDCMGFNVDDREILGGIPKEKIKTALNSWPFQKLIKNWPPTRGQIMNTVLMALGMPIPKSCNCDQLPFDEGQMPIKAESVVTINNLSASLDIETKRPISMHHFQILCSQCHGIASRKPLHLNNPKEFRQYVTANRI